MEQVLRAIDKNTGAVKVVFGGDASDQHAGAGSQDTPIPNIASTGPSEAKPPFLMPKQSQKIWVHPSDDCFDVFPSASSHVNAEITAQAAPLAPETKLHIVAQDEKAVGAAAANQGGSSELDGYAAKSPEDALERDMPVVNGTIVWYR
jgi:hypothetical protein